MIGRREGSFRVQEFDDAVPMDNQPLQETGT